MQQYWEPTSPVLADHNASAEDGHQVREGAECGGHHVVVGVPHAEPQLRQDLVLQNVNGEESREGREVAERWNEIKYCLAMAMVVAITKKWPQIKIKFRE